MTTSTISQGADSLQRIKARKIELKQAQQQNLKERLMYKAAKTYQEVDYSQEWHLVYSASVFLSWMANSYSFATGAFAMGWLCFLWLSGFVSFAVAATVALGLAFSLALCLELLKRIIAKVTFKRWFRKKGAVLLPLSALLGFISLSVGLSFYASLHIPSKLAALPVLEDDNETIEEIRRIKDRLSKNWERAFTSKGLATRQRNLKQAKFWAKHLEQQFHIQTSFDAENRKVNFQTLKTA